MFNRISPECRRIIIALLISSFFHLLPFVSSWFSLANVQKTQQIILQTTLQLPAPAANTRPAPQASMKPREHTQNASKVAQMQKVLTSNSADNLPAIDFNTQNIASTSPPEEPALPDAADSGATIVQDAGPPVYPAEALRRNLESCVLAVAEVTDSGEVKSVRILDADVEGVFDQSVIDAQLAATYLPAKRGGENVFSWALVVVDFVLEPGQNHHCASRYAAAARSINSLARAAVIDVAAIRAMIRGDNAEPQ